MLREITRITQEPDGPQRRWFTDRKRDLMVWHRDGEITSFEFCYGKDSMERALRWSAVRGLEHFVVDDVQRCGFRHKMSPVLKETRYVDFDAVRQEFTHAAQEIDAGITAFVHRRLSGK